MKLRSLLAPATTLSSDPIASVRLWLAVPFVFFLAVAISLLVVPLRPEWVDDVTETIGMALVVVWWLWAVGGATRRAGFHSSTPSARVVSRQVALVALSCVLSTFVFELLRHVLGLERAGLMEAPPLGAAAPTQSFTLLVLRAVILAPISEEMIFRGSLFRKWRLRLGPGAAALLTSVLFGLLHSNTLSKTLFALAMAVLYTRTRSIWAPIVAHMLNNLFAVALRNSLSLLPVAVLQAATDWRVQAAALVPALCGTWWLVLFVRRGWYTLGDPVHGTQRSSPVESP